MDNPPTTESTQPEALLTDPEFIQASDEFRSHQEGGLKIRHRIGARVNRYFGTPDKRQKRGAEVLKAAVEQLRTTESELSRMRWFAHHFPTLEGFQQAHPVATTWTAVKELLPKLRLKAQSPTRTSLPLNGLKRSMATLSSKLDQLQQELSGDQREDLLKEFRAVVGAAERCLKVKISVDQLSATEDRRQTPAQPRFAAA
jgi:hypothetical protein